MFYLDPTLDPTLTIQLIRSRARAKDERKGDNGKYQLTEDQHLVREEDRIKYEENVALFQAVEQSEAQESDTINLNSELVLNKLEWHPPLSVPPDPCIKTTRTRSEPSQKKKRKNVDRYIAEEEVVNQPSKRRKTRHTVS
jgi:hypothetical protein